MSSSAVVVSADLMQAYATIAEQLADFGSVLIDETFPSPISECFRCQTVPQITILDYLRRICKYSNCSDSSMALSLLYMDRLINSQDEGAFEIHALNVHRIVLITLMTATKFIEDNNHKNSHWSKIGGISKKELNYMERKFLFAIKFNLMADEKTQAKYMSLLYKRSQTLLTITTKRVSILSTEEEEQQQELSPSPSPVSSTSSSRKTTFSSCSSPNSASSSPDIAEGLIDSPVRYSSKNIDNRAIQISS
eukprot:TRINITY_DN25545_c0_g1_i1.p1 TRINITY_DN25545_c0_g1~~TRINITY_DN25545_c0_g1_i1.p1  ORF type:complete len:258 (-),score=50.35 TRINITY_DN25545_c0_g1_i1:19-768(-)